MQNAIEREPAIEDVRRVLRWVQPPGRIDAIYGPVKDEAEMTRTEVRRLIDSVWRIYSSEGLSVGGHTLGIKMPPHKGDVTRKTLLAWGVEGLRPVRWQLSKMVSAVERAAQDSSMIIGKQVFFMDRAAAPTSLVDVPNMMIWYDARAQRFERTLTFPWPFGVYVGFAGLLERYGQFLRCCGSCRRVFLRTKRQEYCTPACSQRERSKRWYVAHRKEVLASRHDQHARSQRQRAGAPVKVARRK